MKRGRIDIIIDVLKTAMVGVNKTRIVYKANLNFKLADKYLALLQKNGLMEKKMDKYIITEKGERFLERAQDVVLNIFPSLNSMEVGLEEETSLVKFT
ncbi:MAG: winged helix-turn-helix domain-containing protein [Candidatus Methanoperedens sp.]|nr:winged helix-turn-helix domain-containing protein [Candidatus Methanoperedens sp.]